LKKRMLSPTSQAPAASPRYYWPALLANNAIEYGLLRPWNKARQLCTRAYALATKYYANKLPYKLINGFPLFQSQWTRTLLFAIIFVLQATSTNR
jgi:hypothetical protein